MKVRRPEILAKTWKDALLELVKVTLIFHLAYYTAQSYGLAAGVCVAAGLAVLISCIVEAYRNQGLLDAATSFQKPVLYTIEMTDEALSLEEGTGFRVVTPWKLLKLKGETREVLVVESKSRQQIMLLRQPLRDAGMDAELLDRIQRGRESEDDQ